MREVNFSFNRLTGNFLRWTGLFAVILTTAFAGCKVGLGDSVDTEAPAVGILYPDPKSNAIIRDEFVLYGSCQDDKQITAVKVTLTNIDSGETVLSDAPAVVDSDQKHWRIKLNSYSEENKYNGWQFADGKYTVTVRAYDGSHDSSSDEKSSASSSFEIDNTAPVFVIKNPGVLKSENTSPSAYGSIFTVEGTISELHSVSSMEVTVYNEAGECVSEGSYNGEELKAFVEEDIEIAGGTSVIIAQSGAADGRYGKIYGDASGTQRYTCSIKLTDNSKKYVTPPETSDNRTAEKAALGESGNSTYKIYLYDDVYDTLLSQKNEGSKKLSAGDLKNIINGTVADEEARKILLDAEKDTDSAKDATKRLYFSLNPEANPTYNVNGFEYSFDKTDSLQQASAGNAVSVTVSQGLDQTQIDLDGSEKSGSTVKVWMKEYSDRPLDEGNVKEELTGTLAPKVKAQEDDASVGFVEYMKATEESPVTEFEGWKLIFDYGQNNSGESSVSTKTFSVTLPAGSIALNKYYLLVVTGRDIDNVEFSQSKIYGFEGNEAGVPPTLSIEDVYADEAKKVKNLKPSSDFEFKGKAVLNSSSLYTSEFMVKLTVTDQDSDKVIDTVTQTVTRPALDKGWTETAALKFSDKENWTFTPDLLGNESIKVGAETEKSYLYTLEVWGKASSGHESSSTLNVQIDSTKPKVEITSITPTVDEYNETKGPFVNGKIYVKGTVEETNLENVEIEVLVGGEVVKNEPLGKKYSINYEINTTTLTDKSKLEVRLIVVDKVGNRYVASSAELSDYAGLKIDQSTDKPLIKLNNANEKITDKNSVNVDNNLFGTVSNDKISVSVSDDDLIKSVTMKVYDEDGVKVIDSTTKNEIGKSTYSYSFPLPKTEGVYKIQIIAEDDVLSTELSDRIPMVSTEEFYVAVSAGAPTINLNTVKTYLTATPTFSGTVSSEQATVSARFTKVSIGGNNLNDDELSAQNGKIAPANKEENSTAWSVSLNENAFLDNGKYTILFTAANKYGESNSLEAEFTVDNVSPEVKITEYNSIKNESGFTEPQAFYLNPTNIKTIKGTCSDNESGSGIDSVYYYIGDNTGKETPSTENGWLLATLTKTESGTGWTVSLTDLNVEEGKNYPVHIKAMDKAGNISADNKTITLYIDSTLPITSLTGINLFDSNGKSVDGLKSDGSYYYAKEGFSFGGTITEENLESIKINGISVTPSENEWTYAPAVDKDGTYTYKIVPTDKAGNQSEYSIIVTYDTASPAVSVTSPATNDNTKDGIITISGNASDIGSGVKKISYTITEVSESGTPETKTGEKEISESGEWKIENIEIAKEGKYSLVVKAEDVLGNSGAAPKVEFYYDKTPPSLSASISDKALFTYTKEGKEYSVYGSATFNIKAEASDDVSGVSSVIANSTTTLQKGADGSYTGTVVASLNATSISIVASDKYGNTATQTIENIMVDVAPPSLAILSYPENATKDEVTLSGTVSDNIGVKSVVITDSLDSEKSYEATVSGGTWSVTLKPTANGEGANETKDGSHTYTVTAKDEVGNTSTATCRVTTDITAPYWYTGNTENKEPYVSTKASSEEIAVGNERYSLYNSTSLTVAAKAKDETTNVEKLLYNLNDEKDASSVIVWKSADNGNITVENLVQGVNVLRIKAVDEAGNKTSPDAVIQFFVDSIAPKEPVLKSIDSDSDESSMKDFAAQNKQKLVNGEKDVKFTLEVADDTSGGENSYSGIASVELTKIGNKTLAKAISGTFVSEENGKKVYLITVLADEKQLASGSANVTVKDKAGNSTTLGMFNFLLDDKASVVSLASPAGDVNKTISLSGSATDNQEIDEATLKLEYSTDETVWETLSIANAGSEYKAEISDSVISVTGFDTTQFIDKSTIYVRAVISDKAKNEGKSEKISLKINQDSDRPVVKIDNLARLKDGTFILKYGTNAQITGTLSDDDSTASEVVKEFVISETPYDGSGSVENLRKKFDSATGDFTFEPKDTDDGTKTLYFYIEDNSGSKFYTRASTGADSSENTTYLQKPKLYLKTDPLEDSLAAKVFEYKSDSTSPQVGNVEGKISDSLTEYENDYSGISVSFVGGGDNRYLKLKVTASDANGINGILLDVVDSSGNTLFKRATASKIAEIAIDSSTNESDGNFTLSDSKVTSAAKYYVNSSDSITESSDGTSYVWELASPLDLESVPTGSLTITVKLYDNSGLPGNGSYTFMVDNSGPEVKMTSPSSSTIVSGSSISVTGTTEEQGSSFVNSIQWLIPTSEQQGWTDSALNELEWKGEMTTTSTEKAWTFVFNGTDNALLSEYTKDKTYATPDGDGVYTLPIYFKATDALGNYTICRGYSIRYNPDADRPVTQITYPDSSILTSEGYAVLGGTIRVTGTVEIPSGDSVAYQVYLQVSDDEGKFDDSDKTKAKDTYGFEILEAAGLESAWKTALGSKANLNFSNNPSADSTKRAAWWGIPATLYSSKTSWYIKINENEKMNVKDDTNNVKIRVCGVGENGKVGLWSDSYSIHIDSQVPRYSESPLLYQYSTSTELSSGDLFHGATPTSSQAYSSGIYLKGQWYLWTRVTDETAVKVNGISRGSTPLTCGTDYFVWPSSADNSNKNATGSSEKDSGRYVADVYIKIDPTSSLIQNYTITAEDSDANGSNSSTATFEVYADNIAPSFLLNSSSKPILTDGNDSEISMTKLRNSDHVVTFGSTATDTGSGFERIAFYFVRTVYEKTTGETTTVELPIPSLKDSAWENSSDAAYVGEITSSDAAYVGEITSPGVLQTDKDLTDSIDANYSDNALYGVTLDGTVASSEDTTTFTADSDISGYKFIRKGGIIKISGIYYTILEVSGNTITVDGAISTTPETAFVPAALIVDNTSAESIGTWSSGFVINGDDGDGIIESVKKSGSTWTWNASVYLDELEDGPVTLVTMAFDKAGNVRTLETPVMIANNTPRLAKVYLATDLNGDGKFSDNELGTSKMSDTNEIQKFYSALTNGTSGRSQEVLTIESSQGSKNTGITMRNDLGLSFEFVGSGFEGYGSGNGQLCYKLAVGGSALTTATAGTDGNLVEANADSYDNKTLGSTTAGIISSKLKGFKISKDKFKYGEATSGFVYNEWASANVSDGNDNNEINYIGVTLWDSTKGTEPGTGDTTDSDGNITAFGSQWTVVNIPLYIDLVDDQFPVPKIADPTAVLVPSITDPTAHSPIGHVDLSNTLPKKYFTETSEEKDKDKDTKISGTVVFTGKVTDEKRVESISLTTSRNFSSTSVSSKKIATYDKTSGKFTPEQPAEGLTFEITSNEFSTEGGHTVGWSLTVDTSKVESVAASDVKFTVAASDGTNTNASGSTVEPAVYKVDIVPYITGIVRKSTSKSNTDMNRSTYGEYPVAVGDELTISGWNFGTSPTVKVGEEKMTVTNANGTSFTIDAPTNSGELTVTVNEMSSLNHLNNNATETNLDSDGKFDNRYIRVWDVGHYFSNSTAGNKPTMAADNAGNLFSSWTIMGSSLVQMQKNLSGTTKPVWTSYDQPDQESWISIDKKPNSVGDLALIFSSAHVGSSGKGTNNGYACLNVIGGMIGTSVPNNISNVNVSSASAGILQIKIAGNPYSKMDQTYAPGYQLASYAMRRDVSQFVNGKSARYGDNMHFAYYDKKNKALRYTYQPVIPDAEKTTDKYQRTISGWILIDGKSDGQDRVHGDSYEVKKDSDKEGYTLSNLNNNSVTFESSVLAIKGDTLGIAYESATGEHKFDLFTISAAVNNSTTVTFDEKFDLNNVYYSTDKNGKKTYAPCYGTIYKGESNVVTNGTARVESGAVGSYLALDVTNAVNGIEDSGGKPVIVYYDAASEGLRIAYSTSPTPSMTDVDTGLKTWTRQTIKITDDSGKTIDVRGGTYVQAKIDGDNYLHIMYRDSLGKLCYLKSTNKPDGTAYTFDEPMTIDSSGTYGTLSVMNTGTSENPVYVPCVSWLNSEGTANGVKYALLRNVDTGNGNTESLWDVQIVPAVVDGGNHYVSGGELVYVEGKSGSWSATEDGISTADCDAIVGFNTGRMDVVFLKSEK